MGQGPTPRQELNKSAGQPSPGFQAVLRVLVGQFEELVSENPGSVYVLGLSSFCPDSSAALST
jgi:hypothetical protein